MIYNGLEWDDKLADNGNYYTQEEWRVLLAKNGKRLPTVKEFESLRNCKNKKFMQALKEDLIKSWLMTSDVLKNPFSDEERPVVLGLHGSNNGFNIDTNNDLIDWPARGVKETK